MRKAAVLVALALACTGAASGLSAPREPAEGAAPWSPAAFGASAPVVRLLKGLVAAAFAPAIDVSLAAAPADESSHLALGLSDAEITRRLATDPRSLGAMSIGGPSHGALFNAVQVPGSELWRIVEPERSWGAPEAVASIQRAAQRVHGEYPDSPPLYVGHLSAEHGGYLRPHRSHQSGRDVDLGYFYLNGPGWYQRANAKNLDVVRTWALVKAFATDSNVEAIFMDRSVQRLLREHAQAHGERAPWLEEIFEGSQRNGEHLIRHEWGHLTHLHVRFKCTESQAAGERTEKKLVATRRIPARRYYGRQGPPAEREPGRSKAVRRPGGKVVRG